MDNRERKKYYMVPLSKVVPPLPYIDEFDADKNAPETIDTVKVHSVKRVWWTCKKCGTSYLKAPQKRARGGGCPECNCNLPNSGESLADYMPEVLDWWDPDLNTAHPYQIYPFARTHIYLKCPVCGNRVRFKLDSISKSKKVPTCRSCLYDKDHMRGQVPVEKSMAATSFLAEYAVSRNALRVETIPAARKVYQNREAYWHCSICGAIWLAELRIRAQGRGKCPYCGGVSNNEK